MWEGASALPHFEQRYISGFLKAKKSGTPTKCAAKMPLSTATTIR
jgi:hypothetical protein